MELLSFFFTVFSNSSLPCEMPRFDAIRGQVVLQTRSASRDVDIVASILSLPFALCSGILAQPPPYGTQVKNGPFRGHLWADPLLEEFSNLLQRVFQGSQQCQHLEQESNNAPSPSADWENRFPICAELLRKRQKARQDVLELWNHQHLTRQMLVRLKAIQHQFVAPAPAREL